MPIRETERIREEMMERQASGQPQQPGQPPQPVAYDANGNPLYAAPPPPQELPQQQQPQVVHMTRALEPVEMPLTPEVKQKHQDSIELYPHLNLSEHEYVISAVRRHPIGLVGTVIVTALCVSIVLAMMINFPFIAETLGIDLAQAGMFMLIGLLVILLFLIGGYVAIWVYLNNRLYLTNESVIQEIQASLFSKTEQTVSLLNIEDASYDQKGPLQSLLDYGSIRLSTEGEETTYRFNYVSYPKRTIAVLNNAVEAFKNGRPVEGPVDRGDN